MFTFVTQTLHLRTQQAIPAPSTSYCNPQLYAIRPFLAFFQEKRFRVAFIPYTSTKLFEAGVLIKLVAEILGHTQVTTTELYTHITPESLRVILINCNTV